MPVYRSFATPGFNAAPCRPPDRSLHAALRGIRLCCRIVEVARLARAGGELSRDRGSKSMRRWWEALRVSLAEHIAAPTIILTAGPRRDRPPFHRCERRRRASDSPRRHAISRECASLARPQREGGR